MCIEVAKSWNHLQDLLFENSWNPDIQRFRAHYAFRGLSDAQFSLDTSLQRLGGEYQELERHLLRNFKKYAHRDNLAGDSLWHWLSMAQHHGLPTRLLDWTYSPFVAMHFATANIEKFQCDGVIWVLDYYEIHKNLPQNLYELLEIEGANVFTASMFEDRIDNLEQLNRLSVEPFFFFMEPASIDDRIVNQFAFFSVNSSPRTRLSDWLLQHKNVWKKIIIPASLKWEIRDKLDQANITERVLFPGLDGLSSWLKRHYSPKK